jgi:carboxyl-terminal processing protease
MASRMIIAPTRARSFLGGWLLAGSWACSEPPPAPPASARAEPPAAPDEACRDWSTLDASELPPLVDGAQAPLLDQVWRRVLEKHYDPTLHCLRWGELREVYARKVAEAATDEQAYGHINAMLDELGQSHLQLFPPSRGEGSMGPASPALTVRWVEEQLVVVHSEAEGPQGPVHAGSTLLAIDDRPLQSLVEQVRNRSEPQAFPLEVARAVAARLSCERAGLVHKLKLTDPSKDHRLAIRVVPCITPAGELVTLGNLRDVPTHVEHRMLDGQVGYLAFNVWMLPMVKQVQAGMQELRAAGMRALVLDLRGNPGGVGAMAVPVARLLLAEEGSLGTLRFRDFEQELVVEPAIEAPAEGAASEGTPAAAADGGSTSTPAAAGALAGSPSTATPAASKAFSGSVTVLVDEGTASTSEIFIVGLADLGRITVVGARPSAGAALPSVIEELHGGALLQYVVADYRSPKGTVVEGKGIVPDVQVTETREAFAAGRDPVLEAAHQHLLEVVRNVPHSDGSTEQGEPTPAPGDPAGGPHQAVEAPAEPPAEPHGQPHGQPHGKTPVAPRERPR